MAERVVVPRDEVVAGHTLRLHKDGVYVEGPAIVQTRAIPAKRASAMLAVRMPADATPTNQIFISMHTGWEFVEAWYELTEEQAALLHAWADYRKDYEPRRPSAMQARFRLGWAAGRQGLDEQSIADAEWPEDDSVHAGWAAQKGYATGEEQIL